MKLRRVLDEMEFTGAGLNLDYLQELDGYYTTKIQRLLSEFMQIPEVKVAEDILLKNAQDKAAQKWGKLKSVQQWLDYQNGKWPEDSPPPRTPKFKTAEDYGAHYGKPVEFNMNSPAHLRTLLYDALVVSTVGAKKTGKADNLSTDHEVLEQHADKPGIDLLLQNRKIQKLHKTYVKGMLNKAQMEDDKRIHTNFNQHVTVTGRLSSSEPNLQNIPREDKDVKRAFSPQEDDWVIVQMDYAQAEFRMWCQLSEDEDMKHDIHGGLDIHYQTASDFWGIPKDQVTKAQRSAAKFVVFGLMYGRGAASVAKQVGITAEEAESIKNMFFGRYPKAARWLDKTKRNVERTEFVPGFFGRIRRLPHASSMDTEKAAEAKRQAVNSPIQGSAADITGIALIRIHQKLRETGLNKFARLTLTVHDSIILEVKLSHVKEVVELCQTCMTSQIPAMNVKMEADTEIGFTWGHLVSWDDFLKHGTPILYDAVKKADDFRTSDPDWQVYRAS